MSLLREFNSWIVTLGMFYLAATAQGQTKFPELKNTQEVTSPLLKPEEARAAWKTPPGFRVDLFAAEPEVQNPISMAWDARGRLWIAENYTYAETKLNFDLSQRDRILVLEDTDGDGKCDKRTVFHEELQKLTSVEIGEGGVWALAPPCLYFIPDADGDDRPDAAPIAVLDGFDDASIRHNLANGLRWGPDGKLYGRHGIMATSLVGAPGEGPERRTPMNCGMWRYDVREKRFEAVCHGTTNPWGHDWNEFGELFFINTVIGHLWHAIPGAHYRRMYGEDLNPYSYVQIEQTADHVHWDTAKETWNTVSNKPLSSGTDLAGGGHAHCGLLFNYGDQWPAELRGELFTLNFHGRRINREHVEREGATFVGKHRDDLMGTSDVWYRGIDLMNGPDGAVYVLDWADLGECHENDGVHRTSGRIYAIRHGERKAENPLDLTKFSAEQLVRLQYHKNEFYVRQSRRLLAQHAAKGTDVAAARKRLEEIGKNEKDAVMRFRAAATLQAMNALDESAALALLNDPHEQLRSWGVRMLGDRAELSGPAAERLTALAAKEESGLVLTYLASGLQRWNAQVAASLVPHLLARKEFAYDRVYPHMVWFGIEKHVGNDPDRGIAWLTASQLPLVNRCIARRATEMMEERPAALAAITKGAMSAEGERRNAMLTGVAEGLNGRRRAAVPAGWSELVAAIEQSNDEAAKRAVAEISVVFGDGRAVEQLIALAQDGKQTPAARRRALASLVDSRVEKLEELLFKFAGDRDLADVAVRGLAASGTEETTKKLVEFYPSMHKLGRNAALETLASRKSSAAALLAAVEAGKIHRGEVPAFLLRQMQLLGDEAIGTQMAKLWPELRLIASDKLAAMNKLRGELSAETLKGADLPAGRALFEKSCAKCHKLFGEGGAIGPELTGSQRTNLNYLLENIVDPSATLAANFRMSIVVLDDGRTLNGVVVKQDTKTVSLQTPQELRVLPRSEIEEIKPTALSLMPEGLLAELKPEQIRDLVAYLMSGSQVAKKE